jgi:hypothetical protein
MVLSWIVAPFAGSCGDQSPLPDNSVKVGVLMSMSGPSDEGYLKPLEWAKENVNRAGADAARRHHHVDR